MGDLHLIRVSETQDATFGVLTQGAEPFALTLEPAWRDNAPNVSCIPAGEYVCAGVNSPKFGYTFEVKDVPGRTHILFHKGNAAAHTKGCILVGEQYEQLSNGLPGIVASLAGFREFMHRARGLTAFTLTITEPIIRG